MERYQGLFQKFLILLSSFSFIWSSYALADPVQKEEGTDIVARVTVIDGQLERFNSETQEWIVMVQDAPVGAGDQLFAENDTRVEILIPNNTIMRIGEETETRIVSLTNKLTEITLFSGAARLYNNSSQTDIVATTRFGWIEVPPGASADLSMDDKSVEIISIDGSVYFTGNQSSARHEIMAGSASLLVYSDRITADNGLVDQNWNKWNRDLDALWAERRHTSGESREYLPAALYDEAYPLDTYGSWHRVYYEGDYYRFWRPRYVDIGWSPFTVGMWMTWRGDRVWISREPYGYITHHYGNWIYTQGGWYWAPPVSRAIVSLGHPFLNIGFSWYPGRVAWIDTGIHSRWIPLAPFEPFYCRYPWGYRNIAISKGPYPRYVSSHKFRYQRHTVTGHQDNFYRQRKGSHVTRWRTPNRSDMYSTRVARERDRAGARNFADGKEKRDENRVRENRKREESRAPSRQRYSGSDKKRDHDDEIADKRRNQSTRQNLSQQEIGKKQRSAYQDRDRSGVSHSDRKRGHTDPSIGRRETKMNEYSAKKRNDRRKVAIETNKVKALTLKKKSLKVADRTAERKDNQPARQKLSQLSVENNKRSGFQNRSDAARSDQNGVRTGNRTSRFR